jgi:heat shock protein HtpX
MVIALAGMAATYIAPVAILAFVVVRTAQEGEYGAASVAAVAVGLIGAALVLHIREAPGVALRTARAQLVSGTEPLPPDLASRVAAAFDLPAPRVALAHSWSPNAFAVGLSPADAVVAVTTELLRRLNTRELEAVVAHELAHVAHRDGIVMTLVATPAMLFANMWANKDLRVRALCVPLAPIWAWSLLLMWTISRYREYIADRDAALVTGTPEQLMSALQKIAGAPARGDLRGGRALSAFCIVSTRQRRFELLMDHPRLEKRLERLARISRELGKPA